MPANWIKIETHLPSKPEVLKLSRVVGQNRYEVSGRLMVVWAWFDQITASGQLCGVSLADIDEIAGCQGFAAAMLQVGWLAGEDGAMQVPNWERHNGNSAKARALEAEAKRLRRMSDNVSDNCQTISRDNVRPEESRGEKTRVEESKSLVDPIDREKPQPVKQSARSSPSTDSTKDFHSKGKATGPPLDLSDVDWDAVSLMAEAAAKRIPPKSNEDRRAWLKYSVMAWKMFSEAWIVGAADSAANANDVKKNRQALFVRALQVAAEEKHGTPKDVFDGIFARIRIPTEVWKSDVLKPKGVTA